MRGISVCGLIAGAMGAIEHMFAFGDSYTDFGNLFEATQYTTPDPRYYYEGRTTNGPTWVEVATGLFENAPNLTSFAMGGASSDMYEFPAKAQGAKQQVDIGFEEYYTKNREYVDRVANQSLAVFSFGGNDFFIPKVDAVRVAVVLAESIARFVERHQIGKVIYAVSNALYATPFINSLPEPMRNEILRKCDVFKAESIRQLAMLRAKFPRTYFIEFDAGTFWSEATSGINPATNRTWVTDRGCLTNRPTSDPSLACLGFKAFESTTQLPGCSRMPTNVTALATNPAYDICPNPDDYVFWDGSHPTAEMHRCIARFMVNLVKNSPV